MRILVVEDKVKLAGLLRRALRGEGLAVDVAVRGEDALWMATATRYDVVVLDVMLPGIDGVETCRRLRAADMWSPILMLTARDGLTDRVRGLDAGADDYMLKPFHIAELTARLRALGRREPARRPSVLDVGACDSTPHHEPCGATAPRLSCRPRALPCSRCSCATPAKSSRAFSSWRPSGTTATKTAQTLSTSMCAPCASAWTARSERRRSRPSAAPDTGSLLRGGPKRWPKHTEQPPSP